MSLYVRMEKRTKYLFYNEEGIEVESDVFFSDMDVDPPGEVYLAGFCREYTERTGEEIAYAKVETVFVPIYSNTEDHW